MRRLDWIRRLFKRRPPTEYDHEDVEEAARIRDRVETTRLSNLSGSAAEFYDSGRGSHR
jgi:hypothetical protein